MTQSGIPSERLFELKNQLDLLPERVSERKLLVRDFAALYGVSESTVYRCLRHKRTPRALHRSDSGVPRKISEQEMEKLCRIIAAMKIRTNNKKGHHLSTVEAIRLLEDYGVQTPEGVVKAPKFLLTKSTVNRYLKRWGYDMSALCVQPAAVRFQAKHSNDCWQFDLSPSDLKEVEEWPEWVDPKKGRPVLMLYGVVDDRSGVGYQEYHVVYGEDVESALRFLYRAMAPKDIDGFPFQGRPKMIYTDNGPISKSRVFQRVLQYLGIEIRCHMPKGRDGRRTTARAKGKIERPFRTVKEVHETLYHFHKPKNAAEANQWLSNYLLRYNEQKHRSESHSRIEDWLQNLPSSGIREMCPWDRFCTFAREPERRRVGSDARVSANSVSFEVNAELAGQEVVLWWGMLDSELYIEWNDQKFGPYSPVGGPIPLNRFRSFKKTLAEKRADAVEKLAKELYLPIDALTCDSRTPEAFLRQLPQDVVRVEFQDPDPFHEIKFPGPVEAKLAISSFLGIPLAKLCAADIEVINQILSETLEKKKVMDKVREHFRNFSPERSLKGESK